TVFRRSGHRSAQMDRGRKGGSADYSEGSALPRPSSPADRLPRLPPLVALPVPERAATSPRTPPLRGAVAKDSGPSHHGTHCHRLSTSEDVSPRGRFPD